MTEPAFRLPPAPGAAPRPAFPLVAALAPLVVSALVFAVTGSAFVLVFAALGPVIAVATVLDGRRSARRAARQGRSAARRAREELRGRVAERLDVLRKQAWASAPGAAAILDGQADERRWAPASAEALPVVLGSGSIPSGLRIDGGTEPGAEAAGTADARRDEEALLRFAATVADAPVVVDLAAGIGIVGALPVARACARAVLVQLAHAEAPGSVVLRVPETADWAWAGRLPHAALRSPALRPPAARSPALRPPVLVSVCEAGHPHDATCLLALAEHPGQLPPGCGSVVHVDGPGRATIVRSPGHPAGATLRPHLTGHREAALFAEALRAAASAAGLNGSGGEPPAHVAAASLWDAAGGIRDDTHLACPLGRSADGPVLVDLVTAGPHAIVGGTTGSGKSELLVTWITSMAALHRPEQVTFLLVDFKGGAAFRPLAALPHCVGLVTDLDETEAARALASLTAEVRHRERVLREAGARDVADAAARGRLPRLVIVVDEFQAMLGAFDDLHVLFADLAARGRSLGIHLILCTQRPAGVVRDAVLANCTLRLSLRVNNPADSIAVIGTPDAAALRAAEPGRCLLTAGEQVVPFQVAVTGEADIARVADRHRNAKPQRRPWLEPLPERITTADLARLAGAPGAGEPGDTRTLGLLDEPDEQRYRVAGWRPAADGNLLVIGAPGSGKSSLLAALAAQGNGEDWVVPPGIEEVWDALESATALLDEPRDATAAGPARQHPLLLLDDIDAVYARWGAEHQAAALDMLTMLLRQGSEAGLSVVLAAQRLTAQLASIAALCPSALLLALPSRDAHRAAGGDPRAYDPHLPPGGGHWQGRRVQLLAPAGAGAAAPRRGSAGCEPVQPGLPVLVVSGAPTRTAATLRALRGDAAVTELGAAVAPGRLEVQDLGAGAAIVGDPDAWQSQYGLLARLRTRTALVFERCSLADYRLISRRRDLPPALVSNRGRVWLLAPDGTVRRATWE